MANNESESSQLGHYKGVMLCNRPYGGTDIPAFRSGIVPEDVGINPIRKYTEEKKRKMVPAIVKHKQWLAELQKAREIVYEEETKEMERQSERSRKFHENEARLRKKVQETLKESEMESKYESKVEKESKINETKEESKYNGETNRNGNLKIKNKPKWAYTEEGYKDRKEQEEEEEIDELISFIDNLDIKSYLDDLEVSSALMKIKDRISELAEPKKREDDKLKPGDLSEDNLFKEEGQYSERKEYREIENEEKEKDREEINNIYSESEQLREIHSKQSLKQKIKQIKESGRYNEVEDDGYEGPRIIQNLEDDGMRLSKSSYPGNLPYLHRNPSI